MGIFSSLFNRKPSKDTAKSRLQFVLMHDRLDIAPEVIDALQKDILEVITKYMDVDDTGTICRLSKDENVAALEVSIPVKGIRRASAALADIAEKNYR